MKTIPLKPIFDNDRFNELTPAAKYYLIECLYLLATKGKLSIPLPTYLRQYVYCSNPHLFRFKDVYKKILGEVIPEIQKIKEPIEWRRQRQVIGRQKKKAKIAQEIGRNTKFCDEASLYPEIIPVQIPREKWHSGQYDHVEREKAVKNNESGKEKLLYDK